ncbi:hypothetical protein Tco_1563214 [Tanacetum coccineum]
MVALKFASSHNMVTLLDKPTESDGFEKIVDFLNAYPIKYALTVNPTIYTSCIKQFWTTTKVKTINGEVQIQALVDKKKVVITETSIRMFLDKKVEGMSKHKEIYVTPSSALRRRKHRKDTKDPQLSGPTEPVTDDTKNVASVSTHSNNPLLSGEDILKLNELMELYTSLSQRVLDLEKTKISQAAEITELKKRVKKMERKRKSKPPGMKRLLKIGRSVQVVSSEDEGLGDQEDASKQGRKIANIDTDVEDISTANPVTTVGEVVTTTNVVVSTAKVTTDSTTTTIVDELTMARTLIEIKAVKPKARGFIVQEPSKFITKAVKPKARGVIVQEPSEFTTTTSPSQPSQLPHAKDKGKAKMVEPEKPLKKKDQIMFDKEVAQKLQAQLDAELEEEEKLARQRRTKMQTLLNGIIFKL